MIFSDRMVNSLSEKYLPRAPFNAGGGEKYLGAILQTVEIVGIAGAMTYFNAKHGTQGRGAVEFMGVPADLALGLVFSGLGVTGYFGEHSKHSLNFGCGFLVSYGCRMAGLWGAAARGELPPGVVRGAFGQGRTSASAASAGQYPVESQVPQYPWAA